MNGYWKFHRAMYDHAVWKLPPGQRIVWLTILGYANFKEADWWTGTDRVTIPAGSFITTQRNLMKLSGATRQVVRDALKALEKIGSISTQIRTQRYTQINVINWPIYQGTEEQENPVCNPVRTQSEPSENPNVRREEGKKERELPLVGQAPPLSFNGHRATAIKILEWLNEKSGKNFRATDTNLGFIVARLKGGIADWQLRAIVTRKTKKWLGTDQEEYLRPATLFNKTKCEQYLGELPREDGN